MKLTKHSQLFITKGLAMFMGSVIDTVKHKHHALQITFALDNEFTIEVESNIINSKAILLHSKCEHKLIGINGIQGLILIEPESVYGKIFKAYLGDSLYKNLDLDIEIIRSIESDIIKNLSISGIIDLIITHLNIPVNIKPFLDDRVLKVINLIETVDEKKISLQNLANYVSLSESRLQHLFKSQIGISIKKYLQWKRLMDGIEVVIKGKDFTFAAHEAGFSDSAHMSRVFKEMFGINLLDIFHNSRFIQVFFCKS